MKRFLSVFLVTLSFAAEASMTLGTYNIRNFDYDQRYRIQTNKPELSKLISETKADVMAVQEINNTSEFESFISKKLKGYETELTRCGGAHGQRLGFVYNTSKVELLSFNEDLSISNPGQDGTCDSGSRPLAIALFKIKSSGQKFYALTAHLKSGGQPDSVEKREKQFEIIQETIEELKSKTGVKEYFFSGDLNTTNYLTRGRDFKMLKKFTEALGMIDLAGSLKCSAYWWGGSDDGIESPSLLDHLIVTPGLIKNSTQSANVGGHCSLVGCEEVKTTELGVSYASVSDHCPLSATVQ